ncbi:ornithine acetyltransferase, partial [Dietzia sp. SLG510A3-30A2]|nr:ornithine acetyltransferase [Dietzia sp. SLG510A3-30A2]
MTPPNAAVAAQTIPLPPGFRAHAGAAGLRERGDDVFVVVNDG